LDSLIEKIEKIKEFYNDFKDKNYDNETQIKLITKEEFSNLEF
jgi:hypothetical protein